uniref:Uncharacterized protein n=1 Tax=Aegilops tauschii subsp. strangulata TaxID=200361 RepID=A0A453J0A4_AEGTS
MDGELACKLGCLVVGGGELLVGAGDEEQLVDDAGEAAADEGADPVHPLVPPLPADEGGAEGDGGVHGRAGEGAADQDVGAHDEADGDGRDGAQAALLGVHGRGVHRVHQPEGHHDLQHHRLPRADAGQPEGAGGEPAGGEAEEEAGGGGAQELGDPVEQAAEEGDVAAHEGAEGHGRVHVPAGDVGAHGHRHEQREGVRYRRRDQAGRGRRAVGAQLACTHNQTRKTVSQIRTTELLAKSGLLILVQMWQEVNFCYLWAEAS